MVWPCLKRLNEHVFAHSPALLPQCRPHRNARRVHTQTSAPGRGCSTQGSPNGKPAGIPSLVSLFTAATKRSDHDDFREEEFIWGLTFQRPQSTACRLLQGTGHGGARVRWGQQLTRDQEERPHCQTPSYRPTAADAHRLQPPPARVGARSIPGRSVAAALPTPSSLPRPFSHCLPRELLGTPRIQAMTAPQQESQQNVAPSHRGRLLGHQDHQEDAAGTGGHTEGQTPQRCACRGSQTRTARPVRLDL